METNSARTIVCECSRQEISVKPILVSSGEPAGIGPDLCLDLMDHPLPIVVLGDPDMLRARAKLLGKTLQIEEYQGDVPISRRPQHLLVWPFKCPSLVKAGTVNPAASEYVIDILLCAANACVSGEAAALVTAPIHKAVINQAGIPFTGHTEFFADLTASQTVMLLVSEQLRVSLVTTHLPLQAVPKAITQEKLQQHLDILYRSLQNDLGIARPSLKILGLNPHAGEDGYLGHEEQTVIRPVILACQQRGMAVHGPYSADTAFLEIKNEDAVVAMYHDQGLPVLKFASFGHAVNMTCGLPFVRTSVDHGTALSLSGTGQASAQSLLAAVDLAAEILKHRVQN